MFEEKFHIDLKKNVDYYNSHSTGFVINMLRL